MDDSSSDITVYARTLMGRLVTQSLVLSEQATRFLGHPVTVFEDKADRHVYLVTPFNPWKENDRPYITQIVTRMTEAARNHAANEAEKHTREPTRTQAFREAKTLTLPLVMEESVMRIRASAFRTIFPQPSCG